MKSITYKDGNRQIFVIENCSEDLKKQLFDLLSPEVIGELEAEGTSFPDKDSNTSKGSRNSEPQEQSIKDEISSLNESLDLLKKYQNANSDKVFKKISFIIKNNNIQSKEINSVLNVYIGKRFKGKNSSELIKNFTNEHCLIFVNTFDIALGKIWERHQEININNFTDLTLDDKKKFVKESIDFFIEIGKKLNV